MSGFKKRETQYKKIIELAIRYKVTEKNSTVLWGAVNDVRFIILISDKERIERKKYSNDINREKYHNKKITIDTLTYDPEMRELLGIEWDDVVKRNPTIYTRKWVWEQISKRNDGKRINDKSILKDYVIDLLHYLSEHGLGQTEQINFVLELFEILEFEDYKEGYSDSRFDRIRKTYYEPSIKSERKIIDRGT